MQEKKFTGEVALNGKLHTWNLIQNQIDILDFILRNAIYVIIKYVHIHSVGHNEKMEKAEGKIL